MRTSTKLYYLNMKESDKMPIEPTVMLSSAKQQYMEQLIKEREELELFIQANKNAHPPLPLSVSLTLQEKILSLHMMIRDLRRSVLEEVLA